MGGGASRAEAPLPAKAAALGSAALVLALWLQSHRRRLPFQSALDLPLCTDSELSSCAYAEKAPVLASQLGGLTPAFLDILELILPALGPEVATRMWATTSYVADALGPATLAAMAEGPTWQVFLRETAPPLISLMGVYANSAAVARAAALGKLLFSDERRKLLWAADKRGQPPLIIATRSTSRHCMSLVRVLLAAHADPDSPANDGWTPLMWASQLGHLDVCKALVHSGAKVNAVSRDGASPLLCAVRCDKTPLPIVRLLLNHGGDPALVPLMSPFDEHVDMDVREALVKATRRTQCRISKVIIVNASVTH